jgi:mono/diheme cytochrome c family protein
MNKTFFLASAIIAASLAVMAFTLPSTGTQNPPQDKAPATLPEDVQKIVETSCFDCHSDAGSNVKAKSKINFSNWSELSDSKKIGKMEAISEVLKSGDMPPGKYLEKNPGAALGQEQKDIVNKWITEESAKLMDK